MSAVPLAVWGSVKDLLGHRYAEIDDQRVVANLDRVADIEAYVDALAGLLDG